MANYAREYLAIEAKIPAWQKRAEKLYPAHKIELCVWRFDLGVCMVIDDAYFTGVNHDDFDRNLAQVLNNYMAAKKILADRAAGVTYELEHVSYKHAAWARCNLRVDERTNRYIFTDYCDLEYEIYRFGGIYMCDKIRYVVANTIALMMEKLAREIINLVEKGVVNYALAIQGKPPTDPEFVALAAEISATCPGIYRGHKHFISARTDYIKEHTEFIHSVKVLRLIAALPLPIAEEVAAEYTTAT